MRFLVLGGSGRNGRLVIEEALRRGHAVTALIREGSSLPSSSGLTVVRGSPLNLADVAAALATHPSDPVAAVIVTLGAPRVSDSPFAALSPDTPPNLMADSVRAALAAMRAAKPPVRKIIVNSSHGAGSSTKSLGFILRPLFRFSNMKYQIADHNTVNAIVRREAEEGGLEFVMFRPVMLTDGEAKEVKSFGDDGEGLCFMPSITRMSVAKVMVDAAAGTKWNGQSPVIAN